MIADPQDERVPEVARECLTALGPELQRVKAQLLEFDRMILAWHRSNEASRRLDAIPGVGPALALVASVPVPNVFRSARDSGRRMNWIGAEAELGAAARRDLARSRPHGHKASVA